MKKIKYLFGACILLGMFLLCPKFSIMAKAYESAWFPAPQMNLSQVAYEVGNGASHSNHNAIDILPGGRVFAPFTGIVKQVDSRWGYVLLQSTDKVYYADGSLDYMTVGFMHDENISDIKVGQKITQGTAFYDAGGQGQKADGSYGHVYGNHVDISVFKGAVNSVSSYGRGNIYAYQAFFINKAKTSTILNKGKVEQGHTTNNGAPTDWSNLWKNLNSTTPTIQNASYPSAVDLGSSFTAKGTIIADTQITWVWIGVQYGDGYTHVLETSVNPMTTSYDISKISGNLNFSRLSAGDYTFQIDVIAGDKYYTIVRQPFKVAKKPSILTNVSINISKIELNGKATISWDAVDYATSYIIDGWSDGKETMWKDVGNVTSYTLSNLSAGTYTFYVIASNDGMGSGSSQPLKLQVMDCKTSEMRYPSVIKSGTDFTAKGTITSNSEITWVWIGVQYGSGYTHALEVSANPMSVTYDISRISGALDFSSLACGKYTFQIDAIIDGKYYEIIRKEFSVEKSMSITTSNSENKENLTTPVEESDQAVGECVTDAKSNSVYRIIGNTDGNRTVKYITPLGQKAKVTIPSIVTIQGKDYQVTAIANKAFKNNKKLKKIVIPSTVKKIGKQAFFNCKNLKNIVIKTKQLKNNVVGKKAFKGISAKAIIKVPKVKKTAYRKLLRKKGVSKSLLIK